LDDDACIHYDRREERTIDSQTTVGESGACITVDSMKTDRPMDHDNELELLASCSWW